jgi:AcrR family transcriptional regulator
MEILSKRQEEKLIHEKSIIEAAEKLFCTEGFESSSMDEIAKEAGFTKRTVYQYFESKEDLYYAAALKGCKKYRAGMKNSSGKGRSGFDKIENAFRHYYGYYENNPEQFRLINDCIHIENKNDDSKQKKELAEFIDSLIRDLEKLIEEGKSDGSIQNDVDSPKTACSLYFLMTGFLSRLAACENLPGSFSLDSGELGYFAIELALRSIKKTKTVTATRKGTA